MLLFISIGPKNEFCSRSLQVQIELSSIRALAYHFLSNGGILSQMKHGLGLGNALTKVEANIIQLICFLNAFYTYIVELFNKLSFRSNE